MKNVQTKMVKIYPGTNKKIYIPEAAVGAAAVLFV